MSVYQKLKILLFRRHREKAQLEISSPEDRVLVIERNKVAVGKFTNGMQNISLAFHEGCPSLSIGRYCSIAGNVRIFVGAYHRPDWVTTYPFGSRHQEIFGAFETPGFPKSNGPVLIGNDVWIGNSATIMSGVTVGDGAVIAAGSHVVKDVHPYEIVGGNPAGHIRYRFPNDVIQELLRIKWWDLSNEKVAIFASSLCAQPTAELLDRLGKR